LITETDQVAALQKAILERARELADEHIKQGELTRTKILADTREKIKLREEKELLAAQVEADREYDRLVQASELKIQAELDRNRWGLVQAAMDKVARRLSALRKHKRRYEKVFSALLEQGVEAIGQKSIIASINNDDHGLFHDRWGEIVRKACGDKVDVKLAPEACACSGGVRLVSAQGDVMLDNTFEGIIARREEELQRIIFERLFSTASSRGNVLDG
jgi:V/A-type H+-transporting ATPase subunit E